MSTVMDDLGMDSKIIENLNLIIKLDKYCVLKDALSGIEGVILVGRFQLMMIRWISKDDQS